MASGRSAGSIFVDLLLNDSKYEEGFRRNSNTTKRWASQQQSYFRGVAGSTDVITAAITRLGTIAAGALSAQKIIAYSDSFKGLDARLSLVTNSSQELTDTTQKLFDIAQQNRQPFEDTIDAYVRLSNSLNGTQKASTDLIKFSDLLSKTLLISGTNAAGAATFFQQFGQAASSDFKAIGQELQTFADQNPRFYQILRDEAAKYGKTLKQMASDGELSFEFIANAVNSASGSIEADAQKIGLTFGKAITELDNSILLFIGRSETVASVTQTVAEGISGLATIITKLSSDVDIAGSAIFGLTAYLIEFYRSYNEVAKSVAESTNLFGSRNDDIQRYQENIDKATAALERLGNELDGRKKVQTELNRLEKESAGVNNQTRSVDQEIPKVVEATKEQIKLQRELDSLYQQHEAQIKGISDAQLRYNQTLEDYDELLKAGRISQDEYNAAVMRAGDELERATEKTNVWAFDVDAATKRAAENIQDNLADFLFDPFAQGLDGMLLGFVNVLRRMAAEAAASKILDGIFGSGKSGGGFFDNVLGSIFGGSSGGSTAGQAKVIGSAKPPSGLGIKLYAEGGYIAPGEFGIAGEAGAELLYGGKQGITVIPQDKMGSSGGNVYNIDARGTGSRELAQLKQALLALAGPGAFQQRINDSQRRGETQ